MFAEPGGRFFQPRWIQPSVKRQGWDLTSYCIALSRRFRLSQHCLVCGIMRAPILGVIDAKKDHELLGKRNI